MPDEKTFIIGNGKLAKIGDDVWDSGVATCKKQTIFGARTWTGKGVSPVTGRYHVVPSELFLTRREAIQARIDMKTKAVSRLQNQIANASKEIAKLEAMLNEGGLIHE